MFEKTNSYKPSAKDKLMDYRINHQIDEAIPCSEAENIRYRNILATNGTLPKGVFQYEDNEGNLSSYDFYTVSKSELTPEEINEYLAHKQLDMIKTIRNCVIFFTVIVVLGLIAQLFVGYGVLDAFDSLSKALKSIK
jgi:hypothetical protein